MKLTVSLLLLILSNCAIAQEYFHKKVDFVEGVSIGLTIRAHNDRIFIAVSKVSSNLECAILAELSATGDTLWTVEIPEIDIGINAFYIYDDVITIAGNSENRDIFRMARYDLLGNRLGDIIEVFDPQDEFAGMNHQTTILFQDKVLVAGRGIQGDSMFSLIYILDSENYSLDSLIRLNPHDRRSVMWDLEVTNNDEFLTFHDLEEEAGIVDTVYRVINKFDKDFNLIWSYKTEVTDQWDGLFFGVEMQDSRIAMKAYRPNSTDLATSIRVINEDKTIDWQYDSPFGINGYETMVNLKQLRNGDLLAMGRFSELDSLAVKGTMPYLYRLTSDGEVLWRRRYYQLDVEGETSINGFIRDVIELDNGDIMGSGEMNFSPFTPQAFIFKVDSNGCIDPENCGDVQLITHTDDLFPEIDTQVSLFPNPVEDFLHIDFSYPSSKFEGLTILDGQGSTVFYSEMSSQKMYDVSSLPPGIFTAVLRFENQISTMQFLKL